MKKILFLATTGLLALSALSCQNNHEQSRTERHIENAKDSMEKAWDKASDKIERGADNVKDSWNDMKDDVNRGTEQIKQETKENYNKAKEEIENTFD